MHLIKLESNGYFQSDGMWQFSCGIYLIVLCAGELKLVAIFGFAASACILLFGGAIGHWVDRNKRLKGNCIDCTLSEKLRLLFDRGSSGI